MHKLTEIIALHSCSSFEKFNLNELRSNAQCDISSNTFKLMNHRRNSLYTVLNASFVITICSLRSPLKVPQFQLPTPFAGIPASVRYQIVVCCSAFCGLPTCHSFTPPNSTRNTEGKTVSETEPYTGWFKALVQYLRRLLGISFGAENINNLFIDMSPFPSEIFTLMS